MLHAEGEFGVGPILKIKSGNHEGKIGFITEHNTVSQEKVYYYILNVSIHLEHKYIQDCLCFASCIIQ